MRPPSNHPVPKTTTSVEAEKEEEEKIILQEEDAPHALAYDWSSRKKWVLLTVVAVCQTSKSTVLLYLVAPLLLPGAGSG